MLHQCPTCGCSSRLRFTPQDAPPLFLTLRGTEFTLEHQDESNSIIQVEIEQPKGAPPFTWLTRLYQLFRLQSLRHSPITLSSGQVQEYHRLRRALRLPLDGPVWAELPHTSCATLQQSGWPRRESQ